MKLCTMFQKLKNIGDPLLLVEKLSFLLNGIKGVNEDMNMGKITIKEYRIGIAV